MNIIDFIQQYWSLIMFVSALLLAIIKIILWTFEGVKCSLRNDILQIYDNCKKDKKISKYDLEAIELSSRLYFKLKGNSFVRDIVNEVKTFEII